MKKTVSILLSVFLLLSFTLTGCAAAETENAQSASEIILQIGNSKISVDGTEKNIDENGTVPVVVNNRTLFPVRAVVEAMGGTVEWNGDTQTVTLKCGENEIRLVIDDSTAYLNGLANTLDTAPTIINDRTMLPIRFIAESFGYNVDWEDSSQKVSLKKETTVKEPETPAVSENNSNEYKIRLTAGTQEFTATLYKNATTEALVKELPLTLPMMDLYGREMCYRFSEAFPTDDAKYQSYEVGEIIYWPPGHSFVIMYKQNGENFEMQKLGRIDSGVDFFETSGDIDVKVELIEENSTVQNNSADNTQVDITINGEDFSGVLYNNTTAKQIIENLPLSVSLNRGNTDYCGSVKIDDVKYDESDVTNKYESGDLAYWIPGDDFVVFRTAGTAEGCVIIGKINASENTLNSFGNSADVTITLSK